MSYLDPEQHVDQACREAGGTSVQAERLQEMLDGPREALDRLQEELQCWLAGSSESSPSEAAAEEIQRLEQENQRLREALSGSLPAGEEEEDDDDPCRRWEDLQRRYQMACDDVRQLQAQVDTLERQLAERPQAASGADGLDWESAKQQLLARLESELDEEDPAEQQERIAIQEVIEQTDRIVTEQEERIQHLLGQLEGTSTAPPPQPEAELDHDEQIQAHRDKLMTLQQQWEEKLRKAEIEISIERAKLARERSELEDRIRALESEPSSESAEPENSKATRGRWLARLGLADDS